MLKICPDRSTPTTPFPRHIQCPRTQIHSRHLGFRIQMHQIFCPTSCPTSRIQNPNILPIGLTSRTKIIGCIPIPAPVITRRRRIDQWLWWEWIGIVQTRHCVTDRLQIRRCDRRQIGLGVGNRIWGRHLDRHSAKSLCTVPVSH